MVKTTPNNSKISLVLKGLRHPNEYLEFVKWNAALTFLREPKTQRELADKFGIGEDVLSDWRNRPGFWDQVDRERKDEGRSKTPTVLWALYRSAMTGNTSSIKLWLECFWDFPSNKRVERQASVKQFIITRGDEHAKSLGK